VQIKHRPTKSYTARFVPPSRAVEAEEEPAEPGVQEEELMEGGVP
jgi:hypothetical protein